MELLYYYYCYYYNNYYFYYIIIIIIIIVIAIIIYMPTVGAWGIEGHLPADRVDHRTGRVHLHRDGPVLHGA